MTSEEIRNAAEPLKPDTKYDALLWHSAIWHKEIALQLAIANEIAIAKDPKTAEQVIAMRTPK